LKIGWRGCGMADDGAGWGWAVFVLVLFSRGERGRLRWGDWAGVQGICGRTKCGVVPAGVRGARRKTSPALEFRRKRWGKLGGLCPRFTSVAMVFVGAFGARVEGDVGVGGGGAFGFGSVCFVGGKGAGPAQGNRGSRASRRAEDSGDGVVSRGGRGLPP